LSKYNDTLLTNEGTRLATLAANGKTHYVITRAVTTADDLSGLTEDELRALTALPNEVQDGSIVGKADDPDGSDGILGTQVQFMNQGLSKSYSINAIGLYVKEDGQAGEKFFAIMTAEKEHAQYMPDFADKVVLRFGITIFVIVGDKANVTVQFDPDGLASIKFVEDAIAGIKLDDSNYFKLNTDNRILGNNVFEKHPVDNAGSPFLTESEANDKLDLYQTPAITASTGDVKTSVGSGGDLSAAILDLPRGINSLFVNSSATNNPGKAGLHGDIHIFNAPGSSVSGKGFLIDGSGNMWVVVASGSTVSYTAVLSKQIDLQAVYNQVQTMIMAEFSKRNAPSEWITNLTQAQYAALTTKNSTAEYDLPE